MNKSTLGLTAAMLLAGAMSGTGGRRRRASGPLDNIDLDAEYELIQQKKSRLSRSQREQVVSMVEFSRSREARSKSKDK